LSWCVIHDSHRGVVGTGVEVATEDYSGNWPTIRFCIPWFYQHKTGDVYNREEQLQNRQQMYWFDLQFGVINLLNIPTWHNPEEGRKHTDNWTGFCSEHAGPSEGLFGRRVNIKEGL
jgi:hypothetical protein